MTKIKPAKYFLRRINGVSLYCRVVIAMTIKPHENFMDEIFYRGKIPELCYYNNLPSEFLWKFSFTSDLASNGLGQCHKIVREKSKKEGKREEGV